MKKYITPNVDVTEFENEDVIATSLTTVTGGGADPINQPGPNPPFPGN